MGEFCEPLKRRAFFDVSLMRRNTKIPKKSNLPPKNQDGTELENQIEHPSSVEIRLCLVDCFVEEFMKLFGYFKDTTLSTLAGEVLLRLRSLDITEPEVAR